MMSQGGQGGSGMRVAGIEKSRGESIEGREHLHAARFAPGPQLGDVELRAPTLKRTRGTMHGASASDQAGEKCEVGSTHNYPHLLRSAPDLPRRIAARVDSRAFPLPRTTYQV